MAKWARALLLGLALLSTSSVAAEKPGGVPDLLYIEGLGRPEPDWVVAGKAITPTGAVEEYLFSPADRLIIENYLSMQPQDGCIHLGMITMHDKVVNTSRLDLPSAVRNSDQVLLARVTATAGGFNRSEPGTLLRVEPVETLKGPDRRNRATYIFMPLGELTVGNVRICKTHPLYSDLPEIGEEVLLLVELGRRNKGEFLQTSDFGAGPETGIVTIRRDGEVSLPELYRTGGKAAIAAETRSEFLESVRRAARSEG